MELIVNGDIPAGDILFTFQLSTFNCTCAIDGLVYHFYNTNNGNVVCDRILPTGFDKEIVGCWPENNI
jgi:hypothetical protein